MVVGDVMTDVVVRPSGPPAPGTDCPAAIAMRPGGSGANIACWIGHLGGPATFAGRVGQADSEWHRAALRAHGVRPYLALDAAQPTGRVVAVLAADGERSFYTDRGANLGLCDRDLPLTLLDGVAALHVCGHVFQTPQPRAAVRALMAAAGARGCAVSVDAGSAAYLAACGRDAFLAWTADATLFFANAAEAALLGPLPFARRVVTHGAAGAEAWDGPQHFRAPAHPAVEPDSTGAGDAAIAGFLSARAEGRGTSDCLARAMTAGHRAVTTVGGRPPAVI